MKKDYTCYALIALLSTVLIILSIYSRFDIKKEKTDSEKFKEEYSEVRSDNVFVYKDIDEIIKIMENGTGVVYLGFPECPWCQAYVKYLDEVASEVGIESIYYYNILEDRKNNTEGYQRLVEILGDYLQYDMEGNKRIYVPNVSFHIAGEIIGVDYETSLDTHDLSDPSEYWTDEEVENLKNTLTELMTKVYIKQTSCTECNK